VLVPPLKPWRAAALVTSTIVAVATSPALARTKAAAAVVEPAPPAPAPATSADAIVAARVLLSALVDGRVDEARWNFDEALTASLSTEALRAQWQRVLSSYGPLLSSIDDVDITAAELRVHVQLRHAAAVVGVDIAFDPRLRVHELTFVPPSSSSWVPPVWVGADQVRHIDVVGGVLSVPVHGARNLPAVVLLVDEQTAEAGAVRPFTEVQWGLASRGVATTQLRSPQRADDVIAAVAALAARAEVDARHVVVVAHGKTVQLVPEVLARSAHVAGVGVLASSSSSAAGDVVTRLAGQARPVLIVHAGHDATVSFADLDGWKQGLVLKGNARFRVFPALTHELRAVHDDGTKDPHVDVNVVELLADWSQQR
jgi:hypothetical protein